MLTVPLAVFAIILPAPMPAPPDREYDYDCHDSNACAIEAAVARPSRPRRLRATKVASTTVSLRWRRSRTRGVVGYEVLVDGRRAAIVRKRNFTVAGLACATRYRFAVRTLAAGGARSHRVTVFATTSPCAAVPAPVLPPAPTDTGAPTTPTALKLSAVGPTSVTLSWTASTDNVGVVGYSTLLDGSLLGQGSTTPSFTFTGLACRTRYRLGVQAFDAVGNASTAASRAATTSACPAPPPTSRCPSNPKQGVQAPGNLTVLDAASPCHTATGVVRSTHIEHDGDCHVNIALDANYQGLLNSVNGSAARGELITEVIPSHPLPIPNVGARVSILGTWVNDDSAGWNELHPVWSYKVLSGGTGSC